jgi:hypothetical protein
LRLSLANLKSRAGDLEELISIKEKHLADAPGGKIRVSVRKGYGQYYHIKDGEKCGGRYIRRSDLDLARNLVQKDYDVKVVEAARDELRTLNVLIKKYEKGTCEDIYGRLSLPRRELVTPFYMPDEDYVRKWLSEPYTGLGFEEGDPELYSEGGLRVRSKNEIIAADIYDKYGIPYKYECPIHLKGYGIAYPDFTLLNVRQRKVCYQEIMGKMTESGYADTNIAKIHAYERNGLIQGKNLILSFDTKAHPLLPKDIESVIKNFLL